MKKQIILLTIVMAGACNTAFAQARITLSDGAFAVISGAATLVVDNPAPNAIQTTGTGGKIISGSGTSAVKWNIGNAIGTYVFPFTTTPISQGGDEVTIPLTVNITSPGSNDGSLYVATYKTDNQNLPYPATVTNMYSATQQGDGSAYAIDRFWIIDAQSYTTQPAAILTFGYDDGVAETGGSNIFTESTLRAQNWNSTSNAWNTQQFGRANTAANRVDSIIVPSGYFNPIWTLVSSTSPLPVTLVKLTAENVGRRNKVEWQSAAEDGLVQYVVERSIDGITFSYMNAVPAEGKAWGYITYDNQPATGITYYRLKMVNNKGSFTYSNTVQAAMSSNSTVTVQATPNPMHDVLTINVYGATDGDVVVSDVSGRTIATTKVSNGQATIATAALAAGTYFMKWTNGSATQAIKLSKL